ncbi:hypothetical protein MLD38_012958 [Melastoma candidum]|uniref:Uncharacterized protein n=1 Tax=Melastoma candidum TaxID=119954 RepID=A0ACB9R7M2_9MYRT|nr:hypothetical protein MLD38_012958 [Melastoma candidum]
MKVHQFARAIWDHQAEPTTLSLGCKRLRSLAPKLPTNNDDTTISALDLKNFVCPETFPRRLDSEKSDPDSHPCPPQVETHPGGTRWNPTQEQIGILEMLYRGWVRTPNAQQIEQITAQLGKYGKIEGKNVFYWFQNHKARERQKQKRTSLGLGHFPRTDPQGITTSAASLEGGGENNVNVKEHRPSKRKCSSWGFKFSEVGGVGDDRRSNDLLSREEEGCRDARTLVLFPLRPEGRR